MSHLVAIVYPDPLRAAEVRATLARLQNAQLLELEDSCVVTRDDKGVVKLHQAVPLTATGAVSGAFWGSLIGMLFLSPLTGLAMGAAAGAMTGSIADYGISDSFMRDLAKEMPDRSSAIFMLVRRATVDKVAPEIAQFGGRILHTSVSQAMEDGFRAMLAERATTATPFEAPAMPGPAAAPAQ